MDINQPAPLAAVPQQSKEIFLQSIVESLPSYDWPQGAIESINPDNVRLVYLWGNRFKGTAQGSWSARSAADVSFSFGKDNDKKIAAGTQFGGSVPETEFDLVAINANADLPVWAQKFVTIGFRSDNFQPASMVEQMGATIEGSNAGNPMGSWLKNCNEIVDNYVQPIAEEFASDNGVACMALGIIPPDTPDDILDSLSNLGEFKVYDVNVQTRASVSDEPAPALVPFYVLEFQYNGTPYYIAMMADALGVIHGELPPEAPSRASVDQIVDKEMHGMVVAEKCLKWGWILGVLLLFVNFILGLIVIIGAVVGYFVVKKMVKDKKDYYQGLENQHYQQLNERLRRQLLR